MIKFAEQKYSSKPIDSASNVQFWNMINKPLTSSMKIHWNSVVVKFKESTIYGSSNVPFPEVTICLNSEFPEMQIAAEHSSGGGLYKSLRMSIANPVTKPAITIMKIRALIRFLIIRCNLILL
jgi:hypothetical protein